MVQLSKKAPILAKFILYANGNPEPSDENSQEGSHLYYADKINITN